jgi:hypothetical protein
MNRRQFMVSEPHDLVSRSHAVQYHSLPVDTWQKLRTHQPRKSGGDFANITTIVAA